MIGDSTADEDPWDFGTSSQYPVLSYAGLDTAFQFAMQQPLPDFGSGAVQNKTARMGVDIQSFQVPAASRAIAYTATGLPPGVSFDADGTGACSAQRTICGAPTRAGTFAVTIWALADDLGARRAALRFTITVASDPTTLAVTLAPTSIALAEGASSTYTVVLDTQPGRGVAVTVTVASDNADVTADTSAAPGVQTALTFDASNWNTARVVTATAADDAGGSDETATLVHTVSAVYGTSTKDPVRHRPGRRADRHGLRRRRRRPDRDPLPRPA